MCVCFIGSSIYIFYLFFIYQNIFINQFIYFIYIYFPGHIYFFIIPWLIHELFIF